MRLTVLGCSGTFPGPDSPCSGYLVEHDGFRLVLDFGNGVLGQLQRHVDLRDIDAIYISHLHADHCLDLIPLSYARRYHPQGTPTRLPVHGPPGIFGRLFHSYEDNPEDGLLDVFDFVEAFPGTKRIGPFEVTAAVMNHPVESHGLRLTAGGRTLVYSADSAVSDALVELARDADLFLCEASWPSEPTPPPDLHLTGREAGEHATRAGARRLVLTHVMPFHDPAVLLAEAKETWAGPLELAHCGATYEV
jgi:ribonuclease BN (tRNA processing enzyme)